MPYDRLSHLLCVSLFELFLARSDRVQLLLQLVLHRQRALFNLCTIRKKAFNVMLPPTPRSNLGVGTEKPSPGRFELSQRGGIRRRHSDPVTPQVILPYRRSKYIEDGMHRDSPRLHAESGNHCRR